MLEYTEPPVTNMFAWFCADDALLATIRREGLRPGLLGLRLRNDFDEAVESCPEHLVGVDVFAAEAAGVEPQTFVPPRMLVNVDPCLRPVCVGAAGGVLTREQGRCHEHGERLAIPGLAQGARPRSRERAGHLEVLLIRRRGVWDLPKGKMEPGETAEACARREVGEELGVDPGQIDLVQALGKTIHGYPQGDQYMVKHTSWYQMTTSEYRFEPQVEEAIEMAEWFGWEEASRRVGFESLRRHLGCIATLVDAPRP